MAKGIYKFYRDCDRFGSLEGIFIEDSDRIEASIGKEMYFYEVLGKHSEITLDLEEVDIVLVTEDENIISLFEENQMQMGINPIEYLRENRG